MTAFLNRKFSSTSLLMFYQQTTPSKQRLHHILVSKLCTIVGMTRWAEVSHRGKLMKAIMLITRCPDFILRDIKQTLILVVIAWCPSNSGRDNCHNQKNVQDCMPQCTRNPRYIANKHRSEGHNCIILDQSANFQVSRDSEGPDF